MTPRLKPGAFHLTRGCEWAGLKRIYCEAPKSGEIPGCVEIGEYGVATVQTAKIGLTLAVGLFAVATLAAGATRVPRIDRDDPHALNLGFVLDEGPQLEEAPAALSIALRPPNRGPRANTLQVFQGNPARRVLGGRNDLLADAMILDATKPAFAAREGLQSFPRTSRAGLLQGGAIPLMASADAFDRRAGVGRAVTIGGEVHDPEVDAEKVSRLNRRAVWHVNRHEQKPLAVLAPHEVGLTDRCRKPLALIAPHHDGDSHAAVERQQADAVDAFERQDARVVGHRRVRAECRADRLIALERFAGLRNTADGHLGRQPEPLANRVVDGLLQVDLVGGLEPEGFARDPRRGGIEPFDGAPQLDGLGARRQELQLQRQGHRVRSIAIIVHTVNDTGGRRFLPTAQAGGFRVVIW